MSFDDVPLSGLRNLRDEQLVKGLFATADTTQQKINERLDGEDETAALSSGRDQRLHEPLDDLDELRERRDDVETWGFPALAEEYDERINELEDDRKDEAALKERRRRAALAEPDPDVREITQAALSSEDAAESTKRNQPAPLYVYERYDVDPRDFEDEYSLRGALREAEPKRVPHEETEEVSMERAALSVAERAELDSSGQTASELIEERHGIDPDNHEDVGALRAAILDTNGEWKGTGEAGERYHSALSANLSNENEHER